MRCTLEDGVGSSRVGVGIGRQGSGLLGYLSYFSVKIIAFLAKWVDRCRNVFFS